MQSETKSPLLRRSHLPMAILAGVLIVYGLATVAVGSWLSARAMQGEMTVGAYRNLLAEFERGRGWRPGSCSWRCLSSALSAPVGWFASRSPSALSRR